MRSLQAGFGSFVATLLLASTLSAQELAAHAAGTRVSVADDSLTSDFEVSGVKVILRRSTANEVVVANLYLIGGDQLFTPQTIGIEPLLLWTSERGTKKYTRDVLRRKMAALGSSIVVDALTSSMRFCAITPWRANDTIAVAGTTVDLISSFATSPGR